MTPAEFRAIRKSLGLSAQKMAVALGFQSGRHIRQIEAGTCRITRRTEMMLAFVKDQVKLGGGL